MIKYEGKTVEAVCISQLEKSLKKESKGKMPFVTRKNLARRVVREEAQKGGLDIHVDLEKKAQQLVKEYFAEAV
ncbi:hypothetical protein [Eubacterium oxidoreducens]|uniref:Uncharacterized protein n=1 Tax=Eubacterium oxidoreducens TaxID=1732 RepID=A0A1G6BAS2_EUBOX|nr:hypothetical protein [Eubacterium oxidoreducens]SDB17715.1 hypothetical protein SAMN02910417_01298 [Eubacterium oxidoreducens]